MDKDFILTKIILDELGGLGYTEVWLGRVPNPHWEHGMSNGVVAAPKRRTDWGRRPALWDARKMGSLNCGNGLREADQAQFSLVYDTIPGHYRLTDSGWFPEESVGAW